MYGIKYETQYDLKRQVWLVVGNRHGVLAAAWSVSPSDIEERGPEACWVEAHRAVERILREAVV